MWKRCGTLLDHGLRTTENRFHRHHVARCRRSLRSSSAARVEAGVSVVDANRKACVCVASDSALAQKLASVERWVVFSDLHVHAKFAPYWQDALASVDKLAEERSAGVLFLVRSPHL
jgi:hypothetical protein